MNRLERDRRWGLRLLLGLMLCVLASCGFAIDRAVENATVEFWTMQLQPQFTEYFQDAIARFEANRPTSKIAWIDVPWSAMERKILAAVSARTAPDVVNLNPNFASLLAGRNAWLDVGARVPEALRQQYWPALWQASILNDRAFGIPWYATTRITIYNTDILREAGIFEPPTTYEELARFARQVKEKTGKYAFFATVVPEDSGEVLESLVQMGVKLIDSKSRAAFNTPEGNAAFRYWVDLYRQGLLPREALTQGHRRAIELYQAGEVALLASGPQFLRTIAQNAPAIADVSEVAPQITGKTGKKSVAVMNLVVPRNTKKPEAAIAWALFITNPENQLAFAKLTNTLPSTQASLNDPYFNALPSDASPVDVARLVSASQLPDAEVLIPPIKDVDRLQQILYDNLQGAMLNQKSVEEALSDAEEAWNRLQLPR
ncbi:sugar ABC transporter substrate-binding protein [Oscillatoriales cyanobacterium LEGE 11467]|uniref:Sugar ABC transporter substrate-binding protein n=1 Tax=Zarconia navalis LEGE 11467 TaxID=1828826 RepID=A0A928VYT4_9CYAN|nr:sugar ABC transporter substrate-binding protein [Zarconia navalis]MBE9040170.1 sugar ABC transporter substrate-binding protein [Zarconia navalis LEGE 11467]